MGTPFSEVNDAFLAKIASDDWVLPQELSLAEREWFEYMKTAIFRFRFPRKSLKYDIHAACFNEVLGIGEVQVLATYMKHEWVKRNIASWEEIKMLYSNKDFSQANHLDKLIKLSHQVEIECIKTQATYSRSIDGKPFDFKVFAGKGQYD